VEIPISFSAKIGSANTVRFSAKWLRQIDPLSRAKHGALTGLEIGRDDPQPEGHIEGIDAQRGPETELADPMLFCMAGSAQRNGVAIARLHSDPTIGSGADMRRFRWRGSAAGHTGELTDKTQVLSSPPGVELGFAACNGAGNAGGRHRS